jgi:hypothetical protein
MAACASSGSLGSGGEQETGSNVGITHIGLNVAFVNILLTCVLTSFWATSTLQLIS